MDTQGTLPSPATSAGPTQHRSAPGKKIAGFCESERMKCHHDCQEKQGFQVEITRFSSRSKSCRSKTLPFAMATRFPSTCPPTGMLPRCPACTSPFPGPRSPAQQAGSTCSKAATMRPHTHTRDFSLLVCWAESFFSMSAFCWYLFWLGSRSSSTAMGRETVKVQK